jgi:hypothetical protein
LLENNSIDEPSNWYPLFPDDPEAIRPSDESSAEASAGGVDGGDFRLFPEDDEKAPDGLPTDPEEPRLSGPYSAPEINDSKFHVPSSGAPRGLSTIPESPQHSTNFETLKASSTQEYHISKSSSQDVKLDQTLLALLEQQNRKRLLMAKQEQDALTVPSSQSKPLDLRELQMRWTLLDEESRMRLMLASRKKQEAAAMAVILPPNQDTAPIVQNQNKGNENIRLTNYVEPKTEKHHTDSNSNQTFSTFESRALGREHTIKASPSVVQGSPTYSYYSARSSPWAGNTPASTMSSPAYYSAHASPAFAIQTSSFGATSRAPPEKLVSEYMKEATSRGLILPPSEELNWSGKTNGGQHVEYERGEEVPLELIGRIGMSLTAVVEKVRCRRILLARKTMVCGRRLSLHDAFGEVEHLQKLRHPHIIQLVGSYLQGKKFSVLLYPVADYDLGAFFDDILPITSRIKSVNNPNISNMEALCLLRQGSVCALWDFFTCLLDALEYLHSRETKHLDIKPGNILVKKHPNYRNGHRVYIADFGISRSFPAMDHSQTDAHIPRTPKYCAPEVWERGTHGRAADIFSMGCVFMEMFTILCGIDLDDFSDFRSQDSEEYVPYRDSIGKIQEWGTLLVPKLNRCNEQVQALGLPPLTVWHSRIAEVATDMLAENPEERKVPAVSNPMRLLLKPGPRRDPWVCDLCYASREVYREES